MDVKTIGWDVAEPTGKPRTEGDVALYEMCVHVSKCSIR